jgi:hypothetical protein
VFNQKFGKSNGQFFLSVHMTRRDEYLLFHSIIWKAVRIGSTPDGGGSERNDALTKPIGHCQAVKGK